MIQAKDKVNHQGGYIDIIKIGIKSVGHENVKTI